MRYLFLLLFLVGCKSEIYQTHIDNNTLPVITSFFEKVRIGDSDSAIIQLLSTNSNINLLDSATLNLEQKFKEVNQISGGLIQYELLKKRYIKDDIAIYSYLAKYEKRFFRFIFIFYNNNRSIKLYKFLFDDDLDLELENSLKLYSINE
jgi:hypothetical protein